MKLKILQIVYSGVGGTGSVATSLIEGDKNERFTHEIIFSGVEKIFSGYEDWCVKKKINYYKFGGIKSLILRDYKIFKVIKKNNPDIVIFHGHNYFMTIMLNLFYKFKLIYIEHDPLSYRTIKNFFLNYFIFIFFDKIIFLYKDYKKEILNNQKILNFFKKKITVIPNGIPIDDYILKTKSNIFRIGMISRFTKGKRQMLLVDSICRIKKENPKIKIQLNLLGNGEKYNIINDKIKKNNLVNEIRLIKSLPEEKLKKWFSSIDLYCHLSDDEGLSTAILHALSNKTLLLVSKNKGNKFLKNHALLTCNNLDNVIENIIYAKNNISFFDKRINIAYNFAKKHYSSEKMFNKYCSVFLDLYEKCN
jgi:glycosyltransferase involved in cell wall biosynthesis